MAGRSMKGMIGGSFSQWRLNKFTPSKIIAAAVLVFVSAMLVIFSGIASGYSPTTYKCISCHNDTDYPSDTDNDSVSALYERPHNNTIMCEMCHGNDPHNITYILQNGTYGNNKSVSAGCPDCHQDRAATISPTTNAHRNIGCVCHSNRIFQYNDPNLLGIYGNVTAAGYNLSRDNIHQKYYLTASNQTSTYRAVDVFGYTHGNVNNSYVSRGYYVCLGCHSDVSTNITLILPATYDHGNITEPKGRYQ